ncbi:MAG: metal ABC transporter substrate-binding protein [Candidatus Eisenbacteria bacterium]|nr:metal ABC transporter substrate-binding protein [Candidatus Eisenbacteria bacterium]
MAASTVFVTGCGERSATGDLTVVATTTLVGDVVRVVGGNQVSLRVLLPQGADPHSFEPLPGDVAMLSGARLVFANGLGLEGFLAPLLHNAVDPRRVVMLSEGGEPPVETSMDHEHEHLDGVDPHVWFSPPLVAAWARKVSDALGEADPGRARLYAARADSYVAVLEDLDGWIRDQVAAIPLPRRVLVTDHSNLGHFASRYGFKQIGAITPGFSTLAEPSARELASLTDRILTAGVPAIFVGMTVSVEIADRIGADAGVRVVRLYTGSLSGPDGPAADYLAFMRFNVHAIVSGLAGDG